ncbi:MAG TPA: wax ester/triacylglycerol synthase family O-acyltransferase [Nocardioides sp.]|nr:wax ester/triacylglycerol synthase family O-acyltransferase [Nocardioides sp.]
MARRPVDPVDTIWLNMDRADNLMVIESLMMLDGPVDWDRFKATVEHRILDRFPVFRQRPVPSRLPMVAPHWEDDPDFDLERHFVHARLPRPGHDRQLQAYLDRHLGRPLDRSHPMWEMHLLDGHDGGSAVYSRLHHSLADGIALMQVLLSLSDAAPDDDLAESPETGESEHHGLLGAAAHVAAVAGHAVLDVPQLVRPRYVADAMTLARKTGGITAKLLLTRNPVSPVNGPVGVEKRVVWADPIPLDAVVDLGHRTGSTVNDVLVSALAGALHRYVARHHGDPVDIPTMVPVNVRPLDEPLPRELGNRFALVLFILPSSLETPFERLAETKRRMTAIKSSPEALLTFGLITGIGRTGPDMERFLVDFFANKASGVTTNVPGPRRPRFVAGSRIRRMVGWAPESGQQTLGTGIFSYAGEVTVGFKVDAHQFPNPEELLADYQAELDELLGLAVVGAGTR